jgi:hypothetical protein
MKMAERHGPVACARCGTVASVDAAVCAKCGLPRGAPAAFESGPAATSSPAGPAPVAAARTGGWLCVCGAVLKPGAYWCDVCGRSGIEMVAGQEMPSRVGVGPVSAATSSGRRRKMRIAIGVYAAAAAVLVSVVAALAASGWPGVPVRSPAPNQVAAAADTAFAGATASASLGGFGGSTFVPAPLASSTGPAPIGPPTAIATTVGPVSTPAPTVAATRPAAPPPATATPGATVTDPPLFVEITSLPASAATASTATLSALTLPSADCQAKVKYHSGKSSLAPGLAKKQVADAAGRVSWSWTVEPDPGSSTATVSCKLKGKSASKSKAFVVS